MKTLKTIFNKKSTASFQIIITGFFLLILLGALLLTLPISSQSRSFTSFQDALFTATSATCVTGLIVHDTATHWSLFGQAVIIILIQIGGMGVITIGMTIMRISGKKIGLRHRSIMQESISAMQVGGIIRLTGFILKISAIIELAGAALMMPVFCSDFGILKGIWYSIFHSISAFCNAGFDLMGVKEPFSSLTYYHDNIYINTVIMLLIIAGGIGFLTWDDIKVNKLHFKKYRLQSKIILFTTLILIFVPAILYFFLEYSDNPIKERILHSLFQSVTARTAGFNTADLSQMSESGLTLMTVLMLVGGSSGSTAGGMKTATLAVLVLSALSVFKRKNDVECFKRRISPDAVKTAGAILFMYIALFMSTGLIISRIENLPLISCLFETGSALGTAGLTVGITTSLSLASKIMLIILMFLGRVGGITLIYAALPSEVNSSKLPLEKIMVG